MFAVTRARTPRAALWRSPAARQRCAFVRETSQHNLAPTGASVSVLAWVPAAVVAEVRDLRDAAALQCVAAAYSA